MTTFTRCQNSIETLGHLDDLELLEELAHAHNIDVGYAIVCAALAICQELAALRKAEEDHTQVSSGTYGMAS